MKLGVQSHYQKKSIFVQLAPQKIPPTEKVEGSTCTGSRKNIEPVINRIRKISFCESYIYF